MKRAKRAAPAPKAAPRRILAKPWEVNPEEHLKSIMDRLAKGALANQYCNLSPADCRLLMKSIAFTAGSLDSAECVVRQIAREHYGEEGKTMTVKDFADRQGYDS